jgi:acyl-CoA thioesterase FadM
VAVPRRFEAEYRVRFDEADAGGSLRPSGFLRFAQDVAWQHSEAAGFGRDWYADRAMHWLVRDVDLQVLAPVTFGDRLAVRTEVVGWRHVWARRRAPVLRGDATVAVIETDWVLLRTDGRPARLPEEMTALLASGSTFTRRRLELGPTPADALRVTATVRPSDVDPMAHLNNAAYVDLIDEAAAALIASDQSGTQRRYRVSYLLPAPAGATVEVACWLAADGSVACRIQDHAGTELTKALVSSSG